MLGDHVDQEWSHRFVELEQGIPHEAVADDDVAGPAIGPPLRKVAPLDVPLEVEPGRAQQLVRLLHRSAPLLGFLPDAQESYHRIAPSEDILGVDRPQAGKLHEFLGRAIDVGPRIHHHDRFAGGGKDRADRGTGESGVQAQDER